MKKSIATLFVIACGLSAAAQGTVLIQNNLGARIVPIYDQGGIITTPTVTGYSVQVFTYSSDASSPFGIQLGPTMTIAANGRFSGGSQVVPGAPPGSTPLLIVRFWDPKTGPDYASALISGRTEVFVSARLGGEGNPPSTPVSMVTGLPNGFHGVVMTPEPSMIALGIVGGLALLARRQTRHSSS